MLNELVRHSAASGGGDVQLKCMSASCALNPGQGIQPPPSCNPALDPFLGQTGHGTVESHVRQSSTDSGLGENGPSFESGLSILCKYGVDVVAMILHSSYYSLLFVGIKCFKRTRISSYFCTTFQSAI